MAERNRDLREAQIEQPTVTAISEAFGPTAADAPLAQIGPYKILRTLGEGGMGTVYLAAQSKPIHRQVALKIIKWGMDTKQVIARFEAEREALALMNHPNVARVFDAGATETGRPFFVMEFVEGVPLTDYCDANRLSTGERLGLFVQVCHAIQHAHQKGIIHRDIKPSNVLVMEVDSKPVVKVIDFGIAKATQQRLSEATYFTEQGQLIGTPAYMSPEQADARSEDIDTRTDIYSLGVLLYELLVGEQPFDAEELRRAALTEIVRIIREVDPPKPSTRLAAMDGDSTTRAELRRTTRVALVRQLRGDLDWIVMRALEKDRTRRYETVNSLVLEIQRFLNHEPVLAGPPSAIYRMRKFVRRNRGFLAGVCAVVLALAAGLVGTALMYVRASQERDRAREAEQLAQDRLEETTQARDESEQVTTFLSDMLAAVDPEQQGKDVTVREVLDKSAEKIGEKFSGKPLIEARLRHTVGWTYRGLGLLEPAERHLAESAAIYTHHLGSHDQRTVAAVNQYSTAIRDRGRYGESEAKQRGILEILVRTKGEEHPDTLLAMDNLANSLDKQGRYVESADLRRRTLEIQRRVLGDEHPSTLNTMANFSSTLLDQGNYVEAEQLTRACLEIYRRVEGKQHPNTLLLMGNIGNSLDALGRHAEAEAIFREVLEIQLRKLGPEHPDTLWSQNGVANGLQGQGRYAEAEELYRKTFESQLRIMGEEHPDTLGSTLNLASSIYYQGRYSEAEKLYRQVLGVHRRVLGEDHQDTLWSMTNLANCLFDQGRFAESEELRRKALGIQRRVLGEEHPDTLTTEGNLANVLLFQGRFDEAEPLYFKTLETQRRVIGEEHPETLGTMNNMAYAFREHDRYAEAEELYHKTIEIKNRILGPEHPDTLRSMTGLADTLSRLARDAEAEELYRKSLEIQRRVLGEKHPGTAETMYGLAAVLEKFRRWIEAEQICREAESILALRLPPYHRDRELVANLLGGILCGLGRYAEAAPLLTESYQVLSSDPGLSHVAKREIMERMVRLYESWGVAEPGNGHDIEAAEWRTKLNKFNAEPGAGQGGMGAGADGPGTRG